MKRPRSPDLASASAFALDELTSEPTMAVAAPAPTLPAAAAPNAAPGDPLAEPGAAPGVPPARFPAHLSEADITMCRTEPAVVVGALPRVPDTRFFEAPHRLVVSQLIAAIKRTAQVRVTRVAVRRCLCVSYQRALLSNVATRSILPGA